MRQQNPFFHANEDGTWQCDLCPNACRLRDGQLGACRVRVGRLHGIESLVYGEPVATHVDPIEKKPLNHYFPGERIFSLGTLGCNLRCRGCQNDSLSRGTYIEGSEKIAPERVVQAALRSGCRMIAYTYNEPIVWAEYAMDIAAAAHAAKMRNVLVSAAYIQPDALQRFIEPFDAANIDLKGFSEAFYRDWAGGRLGDVLCALEVMHRKPGFWLEITTLVIPGINDSDAMLEAEFDWIVSHLGVDVPLHLSAFHPACEALEIGCTPLQTLVHAAELANRAGIRFVYLGNVRCNADTTCPACGTTLVSREGYRVSIQALREGKCNRCGTDIPGIWQ